MSNTETLNKNKIDFKNILLSPIKIVLYALIGLKALTIDLIYNLFNYSKYKQTKKAIKEAKKTYKSSDAEIDETYFAIKGKGAFDSKKYKYSIKTEKKLQLEKENLNKLLIDAANNPSHKNTSIIYEYKIKNKQGKLITGHITGYTVEELNTFLVNTGNEVFSIKTSKWINFAYKEINIGSSGKLSTKELIFFLTQLATYLKAGITLTESLNVLSQQIRKENKKKRAYQAISYELSMGHSFSNALEKQGEYFPALLINMIKASEASGTLIETLENMRDYYTDVNTTKKQLMSSLAYPITILIFATIVITFVVIYIVPQFTSIYETNTTEIIGLTAFVIGVSNFLRSYIVFILFALIIFIALFIFCYKNIMTFRVTIQISLMKIPGLKNLIIYNELAVFTKTFSSLLKNNVYITDSVDILSKITNNEVYKAILYKTVNNIVKGEKISEAFKDHWAIPDVAYHMIVTGEETGELGEMMEKVSKFYQEAHKTLANSIKVLIEPLLTAFLAIVVGLIIIAVIIPMYQIYENVFV